MIIDPIISKNVVLIKDANGKDIERIYDRSGNLVFKNWKTLEGPFPIECFTSSNKLRNYRIYGNTIQDGTPTPETPVEVQGCGEQTENLFDKDTAVVYSAWILSNGNWFYASDSRSVRIQVKPNTQYTLSTEGTYKIFRILEIQSDDVPTKQNRYPQIPSILIMRGEDQSHYTFKTSENAKYIVFQSNLSVVNKWLSELMLVEGDSVRSDYIPYGYKIPVVVTNGTNTVTTPVYIGSEPLHKIDDYADYVDYNRGVVVRRIKKLVLTGEERVTPDSMTNTVNVQLTTISATLQVVCTHFMSTPTIPADAYRFGYAFIRLDLQKLYFGTRLFDDDFKTYLATQYSAGTPVTVWYVLDTPEEEVLPLSQKIPTNIGSNTFSCTISPAPSKAMIQYKKK